MCVEKIQWLNEACIVGGVRDQGRGRGDYRPGEGKGGPASCCVGGGRISVHVPAAETIFESAETIFESSETIFELSETIFELAETIFESAKTIFESAKTIFELAKTILESAKTYKSLCQSVGWSVSLSIPLLIFSSSLITKITEITKITCRTS